MIRIVRKTDLAELAELAERTFRATYADHNTAADMNLYCSRHYSVDALAKQLESPDIQLIVSEKDQVLIAFAQLAWGNSTDCQAAVRPVELQRIYVDSDWHGLGVAHELMDDVKDRAIRGGADQLWLGVWDQNDRAVSFYLKIGFDTIGEQTFKLGNDLQRDLVLAMSIAAGD